MTRLTPYLLSAPAALLLAGLLAGPLALLTRVSLYESPRGQGFYAPGTWTAANFEAVADAHGLRLLGFTLLFGVGVATLSVLTAYPLALGVRGLPPRAQCWAVAAVLVPKLGSPLAALFGLQQLLSNAGPVNRLLVGEGVIDEPIRLSRNLLGAALGEAYLIVPYAVLILLLQLLRIDPSLAAAARGLGATPWQAFRRVTLPLSLPGLVLAGQLALVWGLGAFLGPLLLGGPGEVTLSVEAHRQAFEYGRWPRAAADAVALLATLAAALLAYAVVTRPARRSR